MRSLSELGEWERLLKKIIWTQLGDIKNKYILDFGSGEGITANHFAKDNQVVAVEPWEEMMKLEMRVSRMEEFRNVAFFHHLLFSKNGNACL